MYSFSQFRCEVYPFVVDSPRIQGEKARLLSEKYDAGTRYCFEMFYHMFGTNIGYLYVYVKPESEPLSSSHIVWKEKGNQGDMWRYGFATASNKDEDFYVSVFPKLFD